jgi:hypothetical protein
MKNGDTKNLTEAISNYKQQRLFYQLLKTSIRVISKSRKI